MGKTIPGFLWAEIGCFRLWILTHANLSKSLLPKTLTHSMVHSPFTLRSLTPRFFITDNQPSPNTPPPPGSPAHAPSC